MFDTTTQPPTLHKTNTPTQQKNKNDQSKEIAKIASVGIGSFVALAILMGLWILVGFIAFIMSIVCFGRSGTTEQHILGLLLAILFGPFYWIYYGMSKTYCGAV